ncbi:MAG: ABC transporter ATP-binding protein [Deltaproteobacteria bacterium]|nr:ABC transporter ATP-binding protein [Deltaproteobacteria bacterium]
MTKSNSIISIRNVTKKFGSAFTAVDNVSLDIQEGEFFALLGPSGCGKTTLLRMIAGFENLTTGRISIDGQDMDGVDPNRRPVNMVFQSYAVFPHMTVAKNAGYGLKVTGVARRKIEERVTEVLSLVKLNGFEERFPHQLSGGQQQRVALARALIKKPKVLLLDEPLSALDAKLREAMQIELVKLQKSVGITFIIVTHSQDEALSVADRIAVMEAGKLRQTASPTELYENPNSRFCADFIGKINLLKAEVAGVEDGRLLVEIKGGERKIKVPYDGEAQGEISIAIRPEKLRLSTQEPDGEAIKFLVKLTNMVYYGNTSHVYVENAGGLRLTVDFRNEARATEPSVIIGNEMWVSWQPEDILVLVE